MKYGMLSIAAITAIICSGCAHTVSGVQQDAKQNGPIVQAAAQQAAQGIEQAGTTTDNVVDTDLTKLDHRAKLALVATKIKARFIASDDLRRPKNQISVVLSPTGIALKGHVENALYRLEATNIARVVIQQSKSSASLDNNLSIKPG